MPGGQEANVFHGFFVDMPGRGGFRVITVATGQPVIATHIYKNYSDAQRDQYWEQMRYLGLVVFSRD
jgi:hypothetical protein